MLITVWSVAADDDNGTYASIHDTESAAYRRLIQLTVDADNKDEIAKAEAFMEAEDFDSLDEWIHEEVIEPQNTYSVDQHKLDVPTAPASADDGKHITRRELASVLHGLRLMQGVFSASLRSRGRRSISLRVCRDDERVRASG